MRVTVRDAATENASWGRGGGGVVCKTVTISNLCPVCYEFRGKPKWGRFCNDGEWYDIQTWENDCGHIDDYNDVLKEAEQFTVQDDRDRSLFLAYAEDWADEMADLQNDTPEYRAAYRRSAHYKPFPDFETWLIARIISDVENAYYDAAHEVVAE